MKIETVHNALGAMMSLHTEVLEELLREREQLRKAVETMGVQIKEAAEVRKKYDALRERVGETP